MFICANITCDRSLRKRCWQRHFTKWDFYSGAAKAFIILCVKSGHSFQFSLNEICMCPCRVSSLLQMLATESQASLTHTRLQKSHTHTHTTHLCSLSDVEYTHTVSMNMRHRPTLWLTHINKNQITSNIVGNYVSFIRIKMCSKENRGVLYLQFMSIWTVVSNGLARG